MMLKFLLTDKDECLVNNGGCNHFCRNTVGSYYCYCKTGCQLHSDKHRCIGTYVVNIASYRCTILSMLLTIDIVNSVYTE